MGIANRLVSVVRLPTMTATGWLGGDRLAGRLIR